MPIVTFPYSILKGMRVPIIPLQILGKDGWHNFMAFVDPGAAFSVFDKDEALRLGLEYEKGKELMMVVGDGSYIPVYIHRLSLKIGNEEMEAEIGFSERLGVGFNLLGRKGIFEAFKVCFDDMRQIVSFEK